MYTTAENIKGLDDPGGEKGVHEADNGKIDSAQWQAGKQEQGADTGPEHGGQRHGHHRRQANKRPNSHESGYQNPLRRYPLGEYVFGAIARGKSVV